MVRRCRADGSQRVYRHGFCHASVAGVVRIAAVGRGLTGKLGVCNGLDCSDGVTRNGRVSGVDERWAAR